MRPIDADALTYSYCPIAPILKGDKEAWRFVLFDSDIDHAPTIDAVPVVRCKDCKMSDVFQNDSSGVMARYCKAFTIKRMVADDDYCSYGERRDDE